MRSETCPTSITICAVILLFGSGYVMAGTWTTLDYPGATATSINGVQGNNYVGTYDDASGNWHSFLYNGTTWATLDMPGAVVTIIKGIDGSNIVGCYGGKTHAGGFLYNMKTGTWTTLDYPAPVHETYVGGISGSNMVGWYSDGENCYGFRTNGGDYWAPTDFPGAYNTSIYGIDGSNLVGYYEDGSGGHGFLYNTETAAWTSLNKPGTGGAIITCACGINGSNIVGFTDYRPTNTEFHGFLYDMTTQSWTALNYPGASGTQPFGISGSSIVGSYFDSSGLEHGYVYTIPEPATLLLLGLGAAIIRKFSA